MHWLADLPDNTWVQLQPAPRSTFQSVVPGSPRQDATLTVSSPRGERVVFTTDRDVFVPEHIGHGIADAGLTRAAVIRAVQGSRAVVADIVKGVWPSTLAPERWTLTPMTLDALHAQCTRQVPHNGPVVRTFTGLAYGGGRLFYWGGAHGSHPGNDIDLYIVAENRWEHQAPPQCPKWPEYNWLGTGTFTNDLAPARDLPDFKSPDGEPFTMHAYENFTYDPPRKRFVWVAGGGTWAYYVDTRTLRLLNGPSRNIPSPISMSGIGLEYDPESDRVLAWLGGPQRGSGFSERGVYALDPRTDTWSLVTSETPPLHGRQIFVAYDPDARAFGILFWPTSSPKIPVEFWTYKPTANAWTRIESFPRGMRKGGIPSFDYDTRNRRFVFHQPPDGDEDLQRLWAWDPVADAWEQLGPGQVRPGTPRRIGGGRGKFKYDPVNNVFWTLGARNLYCGISGAKCGGLQDTYAYRYKRVRISSNRPASPTGLRGAATVSQQVRDGVRTVAARLRVRRAATDARDAVR
ncbi:MAG TPA: hypothetical protein VNN07_00005, partial [Candidatus Tectomicrobia bacterium]|nr:hypothetical protein [Candidatus Tectomicrobia bacterium]